jgi:hypothetical protein
MSIKYYLSAVVLLLVLNPQFVLADDSWLDDLTVTPVAGVTISKLDYRRVAASNNRQTKLNSLSLTLGVSGEKWYGGFNAELPLASGYFLGGGPQDIKRTDYTLSVGTEVMPSLSVFGGYLYTLINMKSTTFLEDQIDSGFFAGASWEMYSGKKSSVSANIAYTSLDGSAKRWTTSTVDFDVVGPTTGLSYGITWIGQLGRDGHTYSLSYKIQHFKFEGTGSGGPQTIDKDYGVLTFALFL